MQKSKLLFRIILTASLLFVIFVYLREVYNKELSRVIKEIIPAMEGGNFSFYSGDRDVTGKINFPTSMILKIQEGDIFHGTFIAKNHGNYEKTFSLSFDPVTKINENSNNPQELALPEFKFLDDRELNLKGEAVKIIEYTIYIPKNIKEGKYQTVASLALNNSEIDGKNKNDFIKFHPAIGINIKIDTSKNTDYHNYEPLITREPYLIARQKVLFESRDLLITLLGISSLFYLYKYFRQQK